MDRSKVNLFRKKYGDPTLVRSDTNLREYLEYIKRTYESEIHDNKGNIKIVSDEQIISSDDENDIQVIGSYRGKRKTGNNDEEGCEILPAPRLEQKYIAPPRSLGEVRRNSKDELDLQLRSIRGEPFAKKRANLNRFEMPSTSSSFRNKNSGNVQNRMGQRTSAGEQLYESARQHHQKKPSYYSLITSREKSTGQRSDDEESGEDQNIDQSVSDLGLESYCEDFPVIVESCEETVFTKSSPSLVQRAASNDNIAKRATLQQHQFNIKTENASNRQAIQQSLDNSFDCLVYYQNVRSIKGKKSNHLRENQHVVNKFDAVALSETWLKEQIDSAQLFNQSTFNVFRDDRGNHSEGGGVLIAAKRTLAPEKLNVDNIKSQHPTVNIVAVKLFFQSSSLVIINVYIMSNQTGADYSKLFDSIINHQAFRNQNLLLVGDFNIPTYAEYETTGKADARCVSILPLVVFFNLKQYNRVCNLLGRWLDLVLSNCQCKVTNAPESVVPEDIHHPSLSILCQSGSSYEVSSNNNKSPPMSTAASQVDEMQVEREQLRAIFVDTSAASEFDEHKHFMCEPSTDSAVASDKKKIAKKRTLNSNNANVPGVSKINDTYKMEMEQIKFKKKEAIAKAKHEAKMNELRLQSEQDRNKD